MDETADSIAKSIVVNSSTCHLPEDLVECRLGAYILCVHWQQVRLYFIQNLF